MKDWIQKNIDPPGIEKKNRGSLFSAIGRIFEIVRKDAETAFKAHFPYLADLSTLRKHGKSLSIPEFPYDSEDEFRERVSTASFFLSRAGERAYIHQQLERHFGNDYSLKEDFLKIIIKILDVSEEDFTWLWNFFDETLDPNIMYIIEELYDFVETILITETQKLKINYCESDSFGGIKYNGLVKYDGHTTNSNKAIRGKYNGTFDYKGYLSYNGIGKFPLKHSYSTPFKYSSGFIDIFSMHSVISGHEDKIEATDSLNTEMRYHHLFKGTYQYDGAIKYNSNHPFGIKLLEEV